MGNRGSKRSSSRHLSSHSVDNASVQDSAIDWQTQVDPASAARVQQYQQQYQTNVAPLMRQTHLQAPSDDNPYKKLIHHVASHLAQVPPDVRHLMLEQLEKDPSHACLFAYTPGPGAAASVRPAATANVAPQQRTQLEDLVKQFKDRPAANSSKEPTTSSEGKQPAVSEGKGGTQEHKPPVLTLKLAPEFRQYAGSKGQAETVRAVISLKADARQEKHQQQQDSNIALISVLDRSGSMAGTRIELLKETSHFLVSQVKPSDCLAFVSYSSGARLDVPLMRMSPTAKAFAHTVIEALVADGSTALCEGTLKGMDQMSEVLEDDLKLAKAVLLCTDGEATDGPTTADEILPRLHSKQRQLERPVTIHTFGIGDGHAASLLTAIAESMSGSYYYVKGPAEIPEAYGDALGGLLSVVATGIRVSITPRPGVTLGSILTGGSVTREGPQQAATVAFNDMYASESRELLVTADVPATLLAAAAAEGQPAVLADVCVSLTDTRSGSVQQVSGVLSVAAGAEGTAGCESDPDPLVIMTAARYEAVAALESADKLAQGGKATEAAALLKQVTEKLEATRSCVPAGAAAYKEISMLHEQTQVVRDTILETQEERECNTRTAVTKVAAWGLKNQRAAASGATQALPSHSAYANASQAAHRSEAVKKVAASMQTKAGHKP